MSTALEELELRLQEALGMSVIGLKATIRALTIAVIGRGHVLLQGPPGLGKTLLSKSAGGGAWAVNFAVSRVPRISCLPTSPASMCSTRQDANSSFAPARCSRMSCWSMRSTARSPKTQSALLEAMEERQVTVERKTYPLPAVFW